jgi:hypothetical protein
MKSPFDDLQISRGLVCELFASFARFEYAMKAIGYCRSDRYGNALPDWDRFKAEWGEAINPTESERGADDIAFLLAEPPEIQKFVDGRAVFRPQEFREEGEGAKALEAAKRVRNNLFHGGKHTCHSPPERDTKLIRGALAVLDLCLSRESELRTEFDHQLF